MKFKNRYDTYYIEFSKYNTFTYTVDRRPSIHTDNRCTVVGYVYKGADIYSYSDRIGRLKRLL